MSPTTLIDSTSCPTCSALIALVSLLRSIILAKGINCTGELGLSGSIRVSTEEGRRPRLMRDNASELDLELITLNAPVRLQKGNLTFRVKLHRGQCFSYIFQILRLRVKPYLPLLHHAWR